MSSIPTESRIFADRYLRETRRLEKLHAGRLAPGTEDWNAALRATAERLRDIGSPIKRTAALLKVMDCLNRVAADTPEELRHIAIYCGKASRTAVLDVATFSADPNPLHGTGNEDGISILLHRIECNRRGVALFTNLHIGFVSRHALARMHQRQDDLEVWGVTAALIGVGVIGYITRNSERHFESALHVLFRDVLLVGTSRPAVKQASDGVAYDNTLFEVRTALPVDETTNPAALEQGRLAAAAAVAWLKERPDDLKPLLATIPPLAWRGDDFTSKVAVKRGGVTCNN